MTEKPFNRSDAESLLQPIGTGNYWKIKKRGVWPKKPVKKHKEEKHTHEPGELIDLEFDSWRPVMVFSASTLPQRPEDRPALPFPFDAKDLAAFMLYGFGPLVADHYGDWEDGPDQLRLNELSSLNFAKRAVKEAFEAYREAQKIVGPYPLELDAKAERARKAWNDADSETDKETKAALDLKMEATAAEAKDAQEKWLEDMVRVLLKPAPTQEAETPAPVVMAGEPAKRKNRKPSWAVEAMPYMKKLYASGKYRSCSVFFKTLKNNVGDKDSPFTLVKGELYCDKAGTTVAESTLGNVWKTVRAQ